MSLGNVGNPVPPVGKFAPGTAGRMLEVVGSQVGVIEGPKDNETIYGAFTKTNFQAWCGALLMWSAHQAGCTVPSTTYTPNGVAAFKKMGTWTDAVKAKPLPGDFVYFDFTQGKAGTQHVGIVLKDNGDGTVTTYEGNTSADNRPKGSQNNGGECALKVRAYKANKKGIPVFIQGFGRPAYKDAVASDAVPAVKGVPATSASATKVVPPFPGQIKPGDKSEGVKLIQQALGLPDDGDYGPMTKKAIVAIQDESPDLDSNGIVGPGTWGEIMKHLD